MIKIKEINYKVNIQILSPHQLGIPQQRERVIFTCIRKDIYDSKYKNKGIFKENGKYYLNNDNKLINDYINLKIYIYILILFIVNNLLIIQC